MSVRLIRRFLGGQVVTIADVDIDAVTISPANAVARVTYEADGDVMRTENAITTDIGDWVTPKVNLTTYEIRFTLNSGSLDGSSSTTGVWLALGTVDRNAGVTRTSVGTDAANVTVEIRRAGTTNVLDSATLTLSATVEV
jgi:hypothetical protein